jgi:transposase InsO family protein
VLDNAASESFWSTLKTEFYDRHHWRTKAAAKQAVGAWIEERYNRKRRHSAIGMIPPVRYEQEHRQAGEAA